MVLNIQIVHKINVTVTNKKEKRKTHDKVVKTANAESFTSVWH